VTAANLGDILQHIVHQRFTVEETKALFRIADLDHSKTIEFREFLIIVAVGYFLSRPIDEFQNETDREIAKGFKYVEDAFHEMDVDQSNSVSIKELKTALFTMNTNQTNSLVLEERFKELDFNGDGDVELKEFLYGVVSWVGFMDGFESDDDIENNNPNTRKSVGKENHSMD